MAAKQQRSRKTTQGGKAGDWKAIAAKAGARVTELLAEHTKDIEDIAEDPEAGGVNLGFGIVVDTSGPNWEMRTTLAFAKKFRFSKEDQFDDGRQGKLPIPSAGDRLEPSN